ncbi:hypothetical protein ABZT03_00460 [Streptomyces sp. NPDC005574]|uniref:hypothetical protein n=1 Tax=Streptomyces sp. NPDC005574 TaxID=3156891 RepID=UPI0033BE0057
MFRRAPAGLGVVCAALLLPAAVGCTSTSSPAASAASGAAGSTASTTAATHSAAPAASGSSTPAPTLREAPAIDADETLAGRQDPTNGNANFSFRRGKKGDAVTFDVRCLGTGRMKVRSFIGISFALDCVAGEVSSVFDQFDVTGVDRSGRVSVVAPPTVRWAMTVGRGAPAPHPDDE